MSKESNNKKAIVLFNLGGPDSLEAVKPFLFNLFNDKNIISLPQPFRWCLATLISNLRAKTARHIYSLMGGKSPILEQTNAQADALEEALQGEEGEYKIFVSMRYWHPFAAQVLKQIEQYDPQEIILLPLYPQFSTTTTGSFFEEFFALKNKTKLKDTKMQAICCYPEDDDFVRSHVALIKKEIKAQSNYRILFSAHGLPQKIIDQGDPYQWQVEKSVERIINSLGIEQLDYKVTYQSKVGPMKWLEPSTENEIAQAAKDGKNLVIVPIAFVSEHSETLVELDIEYRDLIKDCGIRYKRVPTLSVEPNYMNSLKKIIVSLENTKEKCIITSSKKTKICQKQHGKCPCEN